MHGRGEICAQIIYKLLCVVSAVYCSILDHPTIKGLPKSHDIVISL